jgi:hypothetical protein
MAAVGEHRYEVEACPECGEQNETGYCWAHKHAVRTAAIEVVPAEQLRGAVEACAEAYSALTRENDLGPDTSEAAVEAARGHLAANLIRPLGGQ